MFFEKIISFKFFSIFFGDIIFTNKFGLVLNPSDLM